MRQVLTRVTVDENGNLKKDMPEARWQKLCRAYTGKRAELVLRPPKRSRKANGLYWAVIAPAIAEGFRHASGEACSTEEAHAFMKSRYADPEMIVCLATGEEIPGEKTTRHMSSIRYGAFIDEVLRFGIEVLRINWHELDRDQVVQEFTIED